MPYLLDTNIWIQYLKQPGSAVHAKLAALQPDDVAEKYGNRSRRVATVNLTLAPFRAVPFDDSDAVEYARIRHELEKAGIVIGPFDLQIAAICVRHGFTLVTSNVNEFSRIGGLIVEDWLNPATSP